MPLPELIEIVPLEKPVSAEITVPGSKSITNRSLILAALSEGEVTLEGALWSEDTQIMVECLQELGFMVDVQTDPDEACNRRITVYGKGGVVPPGGTEHQPLDLFVGNAGTAARFLAAFLCLGSGVYRLHGVPRMHERPQAALFSALRDLGYRIESQEGNERLPVRVFGSEPISLRPPGTGLSPKYTDHLVAQPAAPLRSCTISIVESSQFASALLLCAKVGGWEVRVTGENAEESPYVALTSRLIEQFPNRGGRFAIEPDASSGSYFLGAAMIAPARESLEYSQEFGVEVPTRHLSNITIRAWPESGWQVDENFAIYAAWGALLGTYLDLKRKGVRFQDMDWVKVERYSVSRITDLGDSIMTAIVLAPLSDQEVAFTDLGRLRVQECERVIALRTELTKCGARVLEEGDTLTIPPSSLHGAEIETYNDHRMAMCFAILGLKVPGIKIKNPACVKKTFPNFFQKLATAPPHGLGVTILDGRTRRVLAHDELFADL
jgi:3-phosphoshikimate 1-carboxyvinyltransferase